MTRSYRQIVILSGILFSAQAVALPDGMNVISGNVSANSANNQLVITNSPNAIIDWQAFSVQSGELTKFVQESSSSSVLNRVTGNDLSKIYGELSSNGNVYLINPNGIVIGPSGQINTAAFFASTHDIDNQNFLDGSSLVFKDGGQGGAIVNLGNISVTDGDVFLIASKVRNEGKIDAPEGTVGLVAAGNSEVVLADSADRRILIKTEYETRVSDEGVVNTGTIDAAKAELAAAGGNVYALAIKNDGVVRASIVEKKGGRIMLLADGGKIELGSNSVLNASGELGGGEINVGGSQQGIGPLPNAANLSVSEGSSISADAQVSGDGGRVILYSDDTTIVAGAVSAKGGSKSGDGGFIEVSGKQEWRYDNWLTNVDVSAPNGQAGTFLIDPNDINIVDGSGSAIGSSPANSNTLNDADIESFLNNSGSLIITTSGTGGSGDVTVNSGSSITWSSANDLTINSDRRFRMDTAILQSDGSGAITIANTGATGATALEITDSTITSTDGNIVITGNAGTSNTSFSSGVVLDNSTIQSTGTGATAATITITGTGSSSNGDVSGRGNLNKGVVLQNSATITSVDGDISINGTGGNRGENTNYGVDIQTGTTVESTGLSSDAATITVTGTSRNRRAMDTPDCFFPGGCTTGYNSSSGSSNSGIFLQGAVNSVNGDVSLVGQTGTNLRSNSGNHAVYLNNGSINVTGDGDVSLQGTSPTAQDFYLYGTSTIGGSSALGDITIIGDEFYVSSGSTLQSRGDLTITPNTSSQTIGLGNGAGALSIDATEFGTFADGFNSIVIGDAVAGSGTANIGTLAISDSLTVFGGTVNTTGPVTESGTSNVLSATTGTAGAVNYAAYADPTTNAAIPAAPAPAPSSGGGSSNSNQEVIQQLNDLDNSLEANKPQLATDTTTSLPDPLRKILLAAVSREKLLSQTKNDSAEYLEQARLEREKEIEREEKLRAGRKAWGKKLDAEEAARIEAYNARIEYLRSDEYREKVAAYNRAQYEKRRKAEAIRLAAEKKAQLDADEKSRLESEALLAIQRAEAIKAWREKMLVEDLKRKSRAKYEALLAKQKAEEEARTERLLAQRAAQSKQWAISSIVNSGNEHTREHRYFSPPGGNAFDSYQRALALDPNSRQAQAGLNNLANAIAGKIDKELARFDRIGLSWMVTNTAEWIAEAELKFGVLPQALQERKDKINVITSGWERQRVAREKAEARRKAQYEERQRQEAEKVIALVAAREAAIKKFNEDLAAKKEQARLDTIADVKRAEAEEKANKQRQAEYEEYFAKRKSAERARNQISASEDRIRDLKRGQSPWGDPGMKYSRSLDPWYMSSLSELRYGKSPTLEELENLDMDKFSGLTEEMFIRGDRSHDVLKSNLQKHYELANELAPHPSFFGGIPDSEGEQRVKGRYTSISMDEPAGLTPYQEQVLTAQMEQYGLIPKFKSPALNGLSLEDKIALVPQIQELKGAQQRAEQARQEGRELSPVDKKLIQGGVALLAEKMGGDPLGGVLESVAVDTLGELAVTYNISLEDVVTDPLGNVDKLHSKVIGEYTSFVTNPVNSGKKFVSSTGNLAKTVVTDVVPQTGKALFSAFTGGRGGGSTNPAYEQERQRREIAKLTAFRDNLLEVAKTRARAAKQAEIRKQTLKAVMIERAKLRQAEQQLELASN